jgi:hypothetical protein
VLEFLYTKPRVTYLAKVRNPNPEMPDYKEHPMPHSAEEFEKKNGSSPFEEHGAHGAGEKDHGGGEKEHSAGEPHEATDKKGAKAH